jgi:hypothetical protein
LLWVILCGCAREPVSVALAPHTAEEASPDTYFLPMSAPSAMNFLVRDVDSKLETGGTGGWRMTGKRPAVRLRVPRVTHLRLSADFWIEDGKVPMTVSFLIDGKVLAKESYAKAGAQHFEKPVDAAWLEAHRDIIVEMELDTPVKLFRIGFLD